jgi:phosphoribosylglycinamide formyltransferase 2
MNRKAIRDLASKELGLKLPEYRYNCRGITKGVEAVGMPCVVKPLMSSSERTINHKTEADIEKHGIMPWKVPVAMW